MSAPGLRVLIDAPDCHGEATIVRRERSRFPGRKQRFIYLLRLRDGRDMWFSDFEFTLISGAAHSQPGSGA